jgi:hypothetical protein
MLGIVLPAALPAGSGEVGDLVVEALHQIILDQ